MPSSQVFPSGGPEHNSSRGSNGQMKREGMGVLGRRVSTAVAG
jgi:hypothetical protein